MHSPTDIQAHIAAFANEEFSVRRRAQQALVAAGSAAVAALIATLDGEHDERVKWSAASTLAQIDDARVAPALARHIHSESPMLQLTAVQVMGKLAYTPAAPLLIDILNNDNATVVVMVVQALGNMGLPQTVAPLIQLLQQSPSTTVQHECIRALGKLNDLSALSAIERFVDHEDNHIRRRARVVVDALRAQRQS